MVVDGEEGKWGWGRREDAYMQPLGASCNPMLGFWYSFVVNAWLMWRECHVPASSPTGRMLQQLQECCCCTMGQSPLTRIAG